MRALIVENGDQRGALAAVRALAASGWTVALAAPHPGLAAHSRLVSAYHRVSHPSGGKEGYLASVSEAASSFGGDVVFGVGDAEVLTLSEGRHRIGASVGLAPHATVVSAFDKATLSARAAEHGFQVPKEVPVEDLPKMTGTVVVKERLHGEDLGGATAARFAPVRARSAGEAVALVDAVRSAGGVELIQEAVDGELIAFVVLARQGRVIMRVEQRATRVYPPDAGVSCRAITTAIRPALAARVAALIEDLGWTGVAEMQFIEPSGGEPHLIDFNGRFYGSLALAVAAGCNLADGWARIATGREVAPMDARPGVRYQWMEADLRRASAGGARLPTLIDIAGVLVEGARAKHSILDARDLGPGLHLVGGYGSRAVRRFVSRARGLRG